jgi:shikimate dehydrogenase
MGILYAEVIGDPISHSKSPLIHNFWLAKLGIEAEYRRARLREDDLGHYLDSRREDRNWRGCSVAMPHKRAAMPLLDALEPAAARIGAVNLVVREVNDPGHRIVGCNTDALGFLEPLQGVIEHVHLFRMARVLGAGGAARAIVAALRDHGFAFVVAARRLDQARELLEGSDPDFNHAVDIGHFSKATDFSFDDRSGVLDLLINATPLGMKGQPPLELDFSHVPPGAVVYDIVYDPVETPMLAEARRRGHATVDGLSMLIGQAAVAFGRLFGSPAPREHDGELRELLLR